MTVEAPPSAISDDTLRGLVTAAMEDPTGVVASVKIRMCHPAHIKQGAVFEPDRSRRPQSLREVDPGDRHLRPPGGGLRGPARVTE